MIFRAAGNLKFETVVKRHQVLLFHPGGGKNLGVVHDPVEQTVILKLPSCSGTVRIRIQNFKIILLVHPDGFQVTDIFVIIGDFSPGMMLRCGDGENFAAVVDEKLQLAPSQLIVA